MGPGWNYNFSAKRLSVNPCEADLLDLFKSNRRVALSDETRPRAIVEVILGSVRIVAVRSHETGC